MARDYSRDHDSKKGGDVRTVRQLAGPILQAELKKSSGGAKALLTM